MSMIKFKDNNSLHYENNINLYCRCMHPHFEQRKILGLQWGSRWRMVYLITKKYRTLHFSTIADQSAFLIMSQSTNEHTYFLTNVNIATANKILMWAVCYWSSLQLIAMEEIFDMDLIKPLTYIPIKNAKQIPSSMCEYHGSHDFISEECITSDWS